MRTPDLERALEEPPSERASLLTGMSESRRYEYWSALALKHTQGLGNRSWQRLLSAFGSAAQAVKNLESWQDFGIRGDLARAFRAEGWRDAALTEWRALHQHAHSILLWDHPY